LSLSNFVAYGTIAGVESFQVILFQHLNWLFKNFRWGKSSAYYLS